MGGGLIPETGMLAAAMRCAVARGPTTSGLRIGVGRFHCSCGVSAVGNRPRAGCIRREAARGSAYMRHTYIHTFIGVPAPALSQVIELSPFSCGEEAP